MKNLLRILGVVALLAIVSSALGDPAYKGRFRITGYYTPDENDPFFNSPKVSTSVYELPKEKFCYMITAKAPMNEKFMQQVVIEGEGYLADRRHVAVVNHTMKVPPNPLPPGTTPKWRFIESMIDVDSNVSLGCSNRPLKDNASAAITRNPNCGAGYVLDDGAELAIDGHQESRFGIDKVDEDENLGGRYHIDLYMGTRRKVANLTDEQRAVWEK